MSNRNDRKNIITTLADIKTADQQTRLSYGVYVRELREKLNLKQSDLAEAANVTERTIRNIELQNNAGQADVLIRIFRVLGIELENLPYSEETERYLALIAPLIERIAPAKRLETISEVISLLSDAVSKFPNPKQETGNVTPIGNNLNLPEDFEKTELGAAYDGQEPDNPQDP